MAVSRNVIEFLLRADASGLTGPLQKAKGDFQSLDQSASQAGKNAGTSIDSLRDRMKGLGNTLMGVGAAMTVATLPLAAALRSGANALMDAEKRAAQTNAVLKSTGEVAGVSADHVGDLAGSLRDMSGVSGGTIREGENMILTFTKIRNTAGQGGDVFDRTTKAALDMSVAMGTDMKTAAQQLGRALNDPIGGLGRLARIGVTFDAQQKQQIENFVRMGDVASAQGVILDEVNKKFGGSAKAFGETTAGQMAKAEAAFTQVKMALASGLAPALEFVASTLGKVANAFNGLDSGTKSVISSVALFTVALGPLTTLTGAVIRGVSSIADGIGTLRAKFASLQESGGVLNAVKNNWQTLVGSLASVGAAIGLSIVIAKLEEMKQKTRDAEKETLKGLAGQISGYGDLQTAVDNTGRHLDDLHQRLKDVSNTERFAGDISPFGDVGKADELKTQIAEAEKQYDELGNRAQYIGGVLDEVGQKTGMTREQLMGLAQTLGQDLSTSESATKFQQMAEAINDVANKSGLTREQVVQLSQTFGVDLTGNTTAAAERLAQLAAGVGSLESVTGYTTEQLDAFAKKLGIDLDNGGAEAADTLQVFAQWAHQAGYDSQVAAGDVNLLASAINATIIPWLNNEQTMLNFQAAVQGIPEQVKRIAESHGSLAEKATQTELAMNQLTQQTVQAYLAAKEQGASQDVLNGILASGGQQLDVLGNQKYPGVRDAAAQYKTQLDNVKTAAKQIPTDVPVTVHVDTDEAKRKFDDLKRTISSFYGTFHIPGPALPNITGPTGARGGTIIDGVAHFAGGGMFDQATAIVGEGKGREWVIPEDPAYRKRAIGLWNEAGAALMATGGVVGGDGASAPIPPAAAPAATSADAAVALLAQIRDLLAVMAALGPQPVAESAGVTPAAPSSGATGGPSPAGVTTGGAPVTADAATAAAAATSTLGETSAAALKSVSGLDEQLTQGAQAALPQTLVGTVQVNEATKTYTDTVYADIPAQVLLQQNFAQSRLMADLLALAVQSVTNQLNVLNATQVAIHIDRSQVDQASQSIGNLAGVVASSLAKLGLSTNQLSQWLGVVLSLPGDVIASAVKAESGGVVARDTVGKGFTANRPTLVGEGNPHHREFVIPTDPAHRSNAMSLLDQLHGDLGVSKMAAGGIVGSTPFDGTAAAVPGTLAKVLAGSMIAAAALGGGGGGTASGDDYHAIENYLNSVHQAFTEVSTVRPGARTHASGALSYHATGDAVDLGGDLYAIWAALDKLNGAGQGGVLQELIYAGAPTYIGRGVRKPIDQLDRVTYNDHFDHVHAAIPRDTYVNGGGGGELDLPGGWKSVGQYIVDHFSQAIAATSGGVGPGGVASGATWSGTGEISTFGGASEYQPTAYDGSTAELTRRHWPYAAMRLGDRSFRGRRGDVPLPGGVWVQISKGGASTKAQVLDWGPGWSYHERIVDVAPYVADAIGADTHDMVTVSGPVTPAMAEGGIIPAGKYDSGGYLPQGLSLAYNGTGKPEPVGHHLTEQSQSVTVNVTVHGSVSTEDDLVDAIARGLQRRARRGFIEVDMAATA